MVSEMLRFGTDGVRGRADVDLTLNDVAALGAAIAREWPNVAQIIGHDGRESGATWLAAFAGGVLQAGGQTTNAGLLPTPALADAARRLNCVAVSITASHNPWHDNGVKVFAPGGRKLTDDEQRRIELAWHAHTPSGTTQRTPSDATPPALNVGPSATASDERVISAYVASVVGCVAGANLVGREVIIDCANGATSSVVGRVVTALGLRAEIRNDTPNGRNINAGCGAMHPEAIAEICAQRGVMGIALDGDGDRLIAVDERGEVVDGDRLIALAAIDLHQRRLLAHDTVVVTSMTNLGFHHAMRSHQISVLTTDVGDRAVLAAMEEGGFVLGGEQSGHIIHALHATTGDGVLSAMLLLDLVSRSGGTLSQVASAVMHRMPQVLRNVRVPNKPMNVEMLLADELARERALLGDEGRIVVRTSGTEPVVRIMVEASSQALADEVTTRLERVVLSRA